MTEDELVGWHHQLSGHGFGLRGLQETRVATREESGVLGFPSGRALTPRGSLECRGEAGSCSVVLDSVTPWTIAHQAPLSMEFSRQEYWIGPAVTRAPPPAFPRNPRGRLGFPGPTQGEG